MYGGPSQRSNQTADVIQSMYFDETGKRLPIECPTQSSWINMVATLVPNARMEVVKDCGHFPHVEQPAMIAQMLTRFASTIDEAALGQVISSTGHAASWRTNVLAGGARVRRPLSDSLASGPRRATTSSAGRTGRGRGERRCSTNRRGIKLPSSVVRDQTLRRCQTQSQVDTQVISVCCIRRSPTDMC